MKSISPVEQASRKYREWLRRSVSLVESDLAHKYEKMRGDPTGFVFFRGTFYRWAKLWENKRKDLRERGVLIGGAPEIFCIGDLHVENFGTWRDCEGRLIWGVNDVDEAYPMRYLNDLVRLATSVFLAMEGKITPWKLSRDQVCTAILEGYGASLEAGGKPFILERQIPWLWKIATHPSRTPEQFCIDLDKKVKPDKQTPERVQKDAAKALAEFAPKNSKASPLLHRRAGVGSLGRPRFVQFFTGVQGQVVRETKSVVPSACVFLGYGKPFKNSYRKALENAVRVPDPFFGVVGNWVVRRLAFDSDKIALESLNSIKEVAHFFHAMGAETANLHLGDSDRDEARRHFRAQTLKRPDWLIRAAEDMVAVTKKDFDDFLNSSLGREEEKKSAAKGE
jgi:Uncharacterized protein conserved in bacteria (DUF2252)